jgi:hypothetical protein
MQNYNAKLKIIVVGAIIVVIVVIIAYFYFPKKKLDSLPENMAAAQTIELNKDSQKVRPSVKTAATGTPVSIKDRMLEKDGFTILVPAGWAEVNYMAGATIVANPGEENLDPVLKKSGFKSYFSVTREKMREKTWGQAITYVGTIVSGAAPEIKYAAERDGVLAGSTMHYWEADLERDGAKFKILVYALRGDGDDLWILTFNTGASMWPAYSRLAPKVFDSFSRL